MTTASPPSRSGPQRAGRFRYAGYDIDETASVLTCTYALDELVFEELFSFEPAGTWTPAAREAARLVFLLAGVSYYKVGAPPTIDLGTTRVRRGDRGFLRNFYLDGLGEFAYENQLSLDDIHLVGGVEDDGAPVTSDLQPGRPLVPFGGGIDSLVSVDVVSRVHDDVALFVVNRRGDPFPAIERAAAATGFPVLRVHRELDPQLLRPADPARVFNGHVPITGILSSLAVLTALLHGRDMVVMSNEWSASQGNLVHEGRVVNHQYSKSDAFEGLFREAVRSAIEPPVDYFSLLRPRSELWVAQQFSALPRFHDVVHSCNRAFHLDRSARSATWCGECDKCCFIDLILSPFVARAELEAIFDGREPLADEALLPRFRALIGTGEDLKPFECVGDVDECRTAVALAHERDDRAGNPVLQRLLDDLGDDAARAHADAPRLLAPMGPHWVPDALVAAASLV